MPSSNVKRTKHLWDLPDGRNGTVALTWSMQDGQLGCNKIELETSDGAKLDVRDLRLMQLGKAWEQGRNQAGTDFIWESWVVDQDADRNGQDNVRGTSRARLGHGETDQPPGRKGRTDALPNEHFSSVAEVYRLHQNLGKKPTKAVAEHFAVSHATAARWVMRARKLGLLSPSKR